MIDTFTYRTKIGDTEFQHTVYGNDIEASLKRWIDMIVDQMNEVYSFDPDTVEQIRNEYNNNKIKLNVNQKLPFLSYRIDNFPQLTYIDRVNKGRPDFIAEVKYLTAKEGGRSHHASSGYRPHFKIHGKKEMTSAEQLFVEKVKVYPGETVRTEIRILWHEAFQGLLDLGTKFQLKEATKLVANGVILDVINDSLKKNV